MRQKLVGGGVLDPLFNRILELISRLQFPDKNNDRRFLFGDPFRILFLAQGKQPNQLVNVATSAAMACISGKAKP